MTVIETVAETPRPTARNSPPSVSWQQLPVAIRSRLAFELGAGVVRLLGQDASVAGEFVARAQLDDQRWVFLRAVPARHSFASLLRREAELLADMPEAAPVARVLCVVDDSWLVVALTDLDGARPNLRPGSPDIAATLTALGRAKRTLTPAPLPDLADAVDDLGTRYTAWQDLALATPTDLDPWLQQNLESLQALESAWQPWASGDTLLHNDIRPDNMVRIGPGKVLITGWSQPSRGAAWLDVLALVPHLILAGHLPAGAQRLALRRSECHDVPAWAITGYAAALCGHWQRAMLLDEPHGMVGLRAHQRRVAAACVDWLRHRTCW